MKRNDILKVSATILVILIVFVGAMVGLNFYTAPLIENNNKGEMYAPAENVMPGGDFEILEGLNVSENVMTVFNDKKGQGYVVRVKGTSKYSKSPMEISIAITTDGKIIKMNVDKSEETKPLSENVIPSFTGQDGTLAGVELTGGSTFTATAIKVAVEEAFKALVDNNLIKEAVKTPEQILSELLPEKYPGMYFDGAFKATKLITVSGNITGGYVAPNNSGYALFVAKGEEVVLVIVNNYGYAQVYDVEGKDVTAENEAAITEALAFVKAQTAYTEALEAKIKRLFSETAVYTKVQLQLFTSVVECIKVEDAGKVYYAFLTNSLGFDIMSTFVVIDSEGKIFKVLVKEIYIDPSQHMTPPSALGSLTNKYVGKDGNTDFTTDEFIVGHATLSSKAIQIAVRLSFDAYKTINVGGAE